jgi:hypothetical protein
MQKDRRNAWVDMPASVEAAAALADIALCRDRTSKGQVPKHATLSEPARATIVMGGFI